MKAVPGNKYRSKRNPESRTPHSQSGRHRAMEISKERHPESRLNELSCGTKSSDAFKFKAKGCNWKTTSVRQLGKNWNVTEK